MYVQMTQIAGLFDNQYFRKEIFVCIMIQIIVLM